VIVDLHRCRIPSPLRAVAGSHPAAAYLAERESPKN